MRRAVVLACLCACAVEDAPDRAPPVAPDAITAQTALLVVNMHTDGSVDIGEVSPRPIAFRQRGPRFNARRHGARPVEPPTSPAAAPGSINEPGQPDIDIVPPAPMPTDGPCAIVVRHDGAEPLVVPVDLGHPGEGGGDVLDRWQDGSVILRAPYFGPETSYTIVRMAATRTVALAETEVRR